MYVFLGSDLVTLTDLISFASWSVFIFCSTGQMEACDLDVDVSDIDASLEIQEFTAQKWPAVQENGPPLK